jgi:hypothetical protein
MTKLLSHKNILTGTALTLLTAGLLTACHHDQPTIVECKGVVTVTGKPLYTDKGTCEKLANSTPVPVQCTHWSVVDNNYVCDSNKMAVPNYAVSDYVKCYAVAAASMNDCGTSTTACGGTIKVARDPGAWVAIPNGICTQIKGAVAKENK